MNRFGRLRKLIAATMGAAMLGLAGSGIASAGSTETIEIEGTFRSLTGEVQDKFVQNELLRVSRAQHPNVFPPNTPPEETGVELTLRFDSFDVDIERGGTLTWVNTTDEGHTVTIVNKSDLPTDVNSALKCVPFLPGGGAGICGETFAKHFPSPGVIRPVIGGGNLKNRGDSLLIGPPGPSTVTAKVTAVPGATLFYMCIFHPEMQGVIKVERPD